MWLPALLVASLSIDAEARELRVSGTADLAAATRSLVVVTAGAPGPDAPKHEALATLAKLDGAAALPAAGPYDIWWRPKVGRALLLAGDRRFPVGTTTLKLDDAFGVIVVRGDDQPRSTLAITADDGEGPGEKNYRPVQTADDFRQDIVVPEGIYAVWIVPTNGAKPQRIAERVRVRAGRSVTVE